MRSITTPIPEATQQADDETFLPEFCPNPGWIAHQRTLSTVARTRHNRLFPVNYLDRQLRKDLKECVRHTVCFARNVCNLMQRLLLYRLYHNHFKAFRHRMPDHPAEERSGVSTGVRPGLNLSPPGRFTKLRGTYWIAHRRD